ncbi:hypothetical protein [Azospirillum argentinense]|uniref:Uncharacterized protein n=1 Tax=Azospirillum brasilense TaxID=192 RepID=A0A4D8QQA3_AZOBR|nr:hypothetical protein [Azospirillum argentinense]QCO07482.1 hypothetical protein D3867_36985 [Azospirillum argentinense]
MSENKKEAEMASNTSPKEAAGNPQPVGTVDNACATCVYGGRWTAADIEVKIHRGLTGDSVVTAEIVTPDGTIWVMAEVIIDENGALGVVMTLKELHIHGEDVGSGEFGTHRLIRLAKAVMEVLDVDETVIDGAVRTTGARPGHRPRTIRIPRKTAAERRAEREAEHTEGRGDPDAAPSGNEEGAHRPDPTAG